MSQALRLRLLGDPVFAAGGGEIAPSASRAVPVFTLLACGGERVARDRVAELLWRRVDPASALSSLRHFLHHLPEALRAAIASERASLGLERSRVDCDLWRVRLALQSGRPAAEVLALYSAPLLGEARFDEFPEFDDWLRIERARLAGDVRAVVEREAGSLAPEAALALAERWLRVDPSDEAMHSRVIALHLAAGRTHAAEVQFEALRHRLATIEGRAPQPATRALLDAAARKRSGPRGAMPAIATSFVGRQDELAELARLASDPHCRLVTLHGPGGVGKTRLAMAFAEEHAHQSDTVCFVQLESAQTPLALCAAVASSLELELSPRQDPRAAILRELRTMRGFLVLDNFEQLVPAAPAGPAEATTVVAEMLRAAPHLKVLVTSRVALGLQEEWLVPVGGLPYPEATSTNGVHDAGVELFVSRARQAYRGFSALAERPHVLAICRAAEGLPLALELAAAQVGSRPCAEIAQDLLQAGNGGRAVNRPDRQASVLRVVEQSLAAASEEQAAAFARLALFQGTFDPARAFAVARVSEGELAELASRALLARDAGGFRMHPLLRQVAAKRLQRSRTVARRVEAAFVADTARRAAVEQQKLLGPQSREAHGRVVANRHDDMLALDLACSQGDHEAAWTLGSAIVEASLASGLMLPALEAWPDPDAAGFAPGLRASVRIRRADLRRHTGQYETARTDLAAATGETDDPRHLAAAHAALAGLAIFQGAYEQCATQAGAALDLEQAAPLPALRIRVLSLLGTALAELGQYERARTALEEALASCESIEASALLRVHPLNALGALAEYTGDFHGCAAIHRQALALLEAQGIERMQAPHWCNLGGALLGLDEHAEAASAFERGIAISEKRGDIGPLTYSQVGLGHALTGLRRFSDAQSVAIEAQRNARRLGSSSLLSEATTVRARAALESGDLAGARETLLEYESSLGERDTGFRGVDEIHSLAMVVEALAIPGREAAVARAVASLMAHPGCLARQRTTIEAWAAAHGIGPAPPGDAGAAAAELRELLRQAS